MLPETMTWDSRAPKLIVLDQRKISFFNTPQRVECRTYEDVAHCIETMAVRGAPAIGIAAAYAIVLAAAHSPDGVEQAVVRLRKTRPTAVNLFWALDQMKEAIRDVPAAKRYSFLERTAIRLHQEDIAANKKIGALGQALLPSEAVVITHCNAGALATGGFGTALGVIRAARENGKKIRIFADETRPRMQGALLTAWELFMDGMDVTVITDSMAAFAMQRGHVDAVIVGADRIAANGDTVNKIGTYSLAIAARTVSRSPFLRCGAVVDDRQDV